ncbi:MAG TPA: hypothetical protein PK858_10730, partial [Saprospiraceae bacterium]|nr:hypothetical protein [Saprospiraceae bacterium]
AAAPCGGQTAPLLVADQTFALDGETAFTYAFAAGDEMQLYVQELTGKKIKSVELVQWPDNFLFRTYDLDSVLRRSLRVPQTGVYQLRFREAGLNKKICRFTLHRVPSSAESARMDTRVNWDLAQYPQYRVGKRTVEAGKKTEMVSLGGQVTVAASKFYTKKPVNAYQFTLPPNTQRWAYRISVGQAATEARRQDTEKFKSVLQTGGVKLLGIEPKTALAAFALGMALDMTVSTAGEDVAYALTDYDNWIKFSKNEDYQAFMQQSAISVDAQRRYSPLAGTYFFALRSNNWVDDINVSIEIEAVTEQTLYETEIYLEPH